MALQASKHEATLPVVEMDPTQPSLSLQVQSQSGKVQLMVSPGQGWPL